MSEDTNQDYRLRYGLLGERYEYPFGINVEYGRIDKCCESCGSQFKPNSWAYSFNQIPGRYHVNCMNLDMTRAVVEAESFSPPARFIKGERVPLWGEDTIRDVRQYPQSLDHGSDDAS